MAGVNLRYYEVPPEIKDKGFNLNIIDKIVYSIILSFTKNNKSCYLSNRSFAEDIPCSRSKVSKSIDKLVSLKLINREIKKSYIRILKAFMFKKEGSTKSEGVSTKSEGVSTRKLYTIEDTIEDYNRTFTSFKKEVKPTSRIRPSIKKINNKSKPKTTTESIFTFWNSLSDSPNQKILTKHKVGTSIYNKADKKIKRAIKIGYSSEQIKEAILFYYKFLQDTMNYKTNFTIASPAVKVSLDEFFKFDNAYRGDRGKLNGSTSWFDEIIKSEIKFKEKFYKATNTEPNLTNKLIDEWEDTIEKRINASEKFWFINASKQIRPFIKENESQFLEKPTPKKIIMWMLDAIQEKKNQNQKIYPGLLKREVMFESILPNYLIDKAYMRD